MVLVFVYGILLYYFFFKPVRTILDKRKDIIQKGEILSQKAKEESAKKLAFIEEKLREARKEGLKKREEAKKELLQYQSELLEKVKLEIQEKKNLREKEFALFEQKTKEEIKKIIPELALLITQKILGKRVAS